MRSMLQTYSTPSHLNQNRHCVRSNVPRYRYRYRYRLIELNHRKPFIWYKDQGGKNKCIELKLRLVDENNEIVTHSSFRLRIQLCFSNGELADQKIMNILSPDSDFEIKKGTGTSTIRVRIEEVSRKKKRAFSFLISADHSDIAPTRTSPVQIRSKPSKTLNAKIETETFNECYSSSDTSPSSPEPSSSRNRKQVDTKDFGLGNGKNMKICCNAHFQWMKRVNEVLQSLKWTKIGEEKQCELDEDKKMVERYLPIYSMRNPNEDIEQLLRECPPYCGPVSPYSSFILPSSPHCNNPTPDASSSSCSSEEEFDDDLLSDVDEGDPFSNLPPMTEVTSTQHSLFLFS